MSLLDRPVADRYESRVGGEQRVVGRVEPVLWGGSDAPGPLSSAQLADFDRDGFVVLDEWIDTSTVDACLREIERLAMTPAIRADERSVLEPDSGALRSLFEVHRTDGAFADIVADERLAGVARQILADDVYVHQSRINLKPALEGAAFSWHSDFETWHVEDGMPEMRAVSCSIALTDNTEWNGPLLMIPGSHRLYVSFGGHTPEENYRTSLRRQEHGSPDLDILESFYADGGIATFAGGAGSVAFFDCNVMHGSPNNISPLSRTNAFFVYNAVSNAIGEPFGTDAPRPSHIAERDPVALPIT